MTTSTDLSTDLHLFEQQMLGNTGASSRADEQSVVTVVLDRLSGRWKWMIIVGVLLGAVVAWLGYTSTVPKYRSVGMVRINPQVMPIVHTIDDLRIHHLRQFVNTQSQLLMSNRVIDKAIEGPHVSALDSALRPTRREIQSSIQIESGRDDVLIFVGYESPEASVSEAVVNGILDAYDMLYGQSNLSRTSETLNTIDVNRERLRARKNETDAAISQLRLKNGAVDFEAELRTIIGKLHDLDEQLLAAETRLARLNAAPPDDETELINEPSDVLLERIHPALADARQIRDYAKTDFLVTRTRHGENSILYRNARRDLEAAEMAYDEERNRAIQRWEEDGSEILQSDATFQGHTPEELQAEIDQMKVVQEGFIARRDSLLADIQQLDTLQQTQTRINNELNELQERYDDLMRERDGVAEQITIAQRASKESEAYSDSRLKRAVAGFVTGGMASFGLFFLIGTFDRRAFEARQLRLDVESPRCLGVLPDLGETVADPETRDMASHCIHQIRNQIEALRPSGAGYVLAISSPFQGDGKTSIVMALGWSYAAAGFRTLMVDCDLVGRSLTRQVGKVGQPGLKEALIAGNVNGELTSLPVENLTVLPVGIDDSFGPESIRRADLDRLFDSVREQFDVVLVDTGPVLGSLESIPVSAAADSVVLSVRRGRSRTRLQECFGRLNSTGSNCLGVILNWAGRSDCQRYVSEASLAVAEAARQNAAAHRAKRTATGRDQNALVLAMESTSRRTDSRMDDEIEADSS